MAVITITEPSTSVSVQEVSTYIIDNPALSAEYFKQLKDTPQDYTNSANRVVTVKADEQGLEFTDLQPQFDSKADDAATSAALSSLGAQVATKLNSSSYTAADVLTKIKTVHGAGSGLDADLFGGFDSSVFPKKDTNLGNLFAAPPDGNAYWAKVGEWTHTGGYSHFHGTFLISNRYSITPVYIETSVGSSTSSMSAPTIRYDNKLGVIDTRLLADTTSGQAVYELWAQVAGWGGPHDAQLENFRLHSSVTGVTWSPVNATTSVGTPVGVTQTHAPSYGIHADAFHEDGASLGSKYLGITHKATDSDKLNGLDSSQFLRSDTDDTFTGDTLTIDACGKLRLDNHNDLELASTVHAFQIGPSTGTNLAMDNNEIHARNNGAASTLLLNNNGGNVNVNQVNVRDGEIINSGTVGFAYLPTGTGASQVAVGNHNHDSSYLGITAKAADSTKFAGNGAVGNLLVAPESIPSDTDWNSLVTPGVYHTSATLAANSPEDGQAYNYSIQVIYQSPTSVMQIATKHQNGYTRMFLRHVWNTTTTPVGTSWGELYHTGFKPSASDVGALAVGATAADSQLLDGLDSTNFVRYREEADMSNTLGQLSWVANYASSGNIDHVWYDDAQNEFHFCADTSYKALGQAKVRAGTFSEGSTPLSSKYLGISAKAADSDLLDGFEASDFVQNDAFSAALATKADDGATSAALSSLSAQVGTKLNSSSYTANDVLAKIKTVDGAGSGLDANTLDGLGSGSFLRSNTDDTSTGTITVQKNVGLSPNYSAGQLELKSTNADDVSMGFHRSGYTACQLRHVSNGLILSGSGRATSADLYVYGNITAYSDYRLKKDLQVIPDALDKVNQLSGYTFLRTNPETGDEEQRATGVVAQEVLDVLPEAVLGGPTEDDPDAYYSVAYEIGGAHV